MGVHHHRHEAADRAVRCAVVVVSDSRTAETDESGPAAEALIREAGHAVTARTLIPNDVARIQTTVTALAKEADVIVTIGGTGPSPKDLTIEAVQPLLGKELPGFGELFRAKSSARIGSAVILSRALLGVTQEGRIVVCLPGSQEAVELALRDVLLPELKHLVWDVRRYG